MGLATSTDKLDISIHALRGEGDKLPWNACPVVCEFQSTPSVGRATTAYRRLQSAQSPFQSTPSVGRATPAGYHNGSGTVISIHALRGEGDCCHGVVIGTARTISIHALRGEGDIDNGINTPFNEHFNPRPPWGGRHIGNRHLLISIRFQSTPSVGRATSSPTTDQLPCRYFNPRPPWGGRLVAANANQTILKFQSTPSVGRATR